MALTLYEYMQVHVDYNFTLPLLFKTKYDRVSIVSTRTMLMLFYLSFETVILTNLIDTRVPDCSRKVKGCREYKKSLTSCLMYFFV